MRSRCSKASLFAAAALAGFAAAPAGALEYRSVDATAAILYDAPSQKGKKLFVIRRATPVEVVVNLEGWAKVRDADGGLAWIEKKALSEKRTVIVSAARATVKRAAEDTAALAFEAEKGVALELVEPAKDGWAKVRHSDGASGYVRAKEVWGL
jgi:SH3-like domain-containing protein